MINIFCFCDLSDSCGHVSITVSFIFKMVFTLYCYYLFYFSCFVVFTQQHKNNIKHSAKIV
jgi:hypothetical protein